jgi:2-hydroxychromene-2-carboxylate isomerase
MRGDYARIDWSRLARRRGVGFRLPPDHPALTTAPGRAFLWLEDHHPDRAKPFARRFFDAYFGSGEDVSGAPDVVALAGACGVPRGELQAALQETALKEGFRRQTDEALERGVFGSPFFFVDGEPFWGADRLPMIDEWLTTRGW